ncbi:MAG: enoyl-CoA hydratase [Kiloniellales bacterium]|jgi:enoyl-CoA hydratase/carnithine racemase|nr:enoyl-CoA hydratase [Kiloniellales bacterium]
MQRPLEAPATQNAPLLREDAGGVATLTLNRPEQYNALCDALLDDLQRAIDDIAADDSVRLLVLAARGRAFSAGHDLKEMRQRPERDYYEALFKKCSRVMMSLVRLPKPVIARVHGLATAAGCQLVASCDLAVAAREATFGTSGIRVGLFCMTPGVALSRNVERKKAFEMLFTGDLVSADEALAFGLVNRVVEAERLDAAVDELAQSILAHSQAAIAAGKRVFYQQLELGLSDAYALAAEEMACNMMFRDVGEGIDAFIAKRKPDWRHE